LSAVSGPQTIAVCIALQRHLRRATGIIATEVITITPETAKP
jgi:hypothetical protein